MALIGVGAVGRIFSFETNNGHDSKVTSKNIKYIFFNLNILWVYSNVHYITMLAFIIRLLV